MTTTMSTNTSGVISMAACAQLPHDLARESREDGLRGHQRSRAIDILAISANPTLSVYLSLSFHLHPPIPADK